MPTKVENHKRENDILLGFLERPALQWLAAHSPAWVTPDVLDLDRRCRLSADLHQLWPHTIQPEFPMAGKLWLPDELVGRQPGWLSGALPPH